MKVWFITGTSRGFGREWAGPSAVRSAELPAYAEVRAAVNEARSRTVAADRGDPAATGKVVLAIVDAEEPPLRIFFGTGPLGMAKADYASRIETWEKWDSLSREAQG